MPIWIVLGVCAVVFVMIIVMAGSFNYFNGAAGPGHDDRPRQLLPAAFSTADIDALTFTPALRGYRMDEVDEVISQLHDRIVELETQSPQVNQPGTTPAQTEASST